MLLKGWNFDQHSLPSESAENAGFPHSFFAFCCRCGTAADAEFGVEQP